MANEYLVRTPTSTGNRKIFTWAGWVKRATPGTRTWIFNTRNQAGTGDFFAFDFLASGDNDVLRVNDSANTDDTNLKTTPSRRDPSSWMHLVLSIDTTKGIEQDRVNIYANGVQISDFTLGNYPTQNALMMVNSLNGMNIGTAIDSSGNSIYPFNGEMFDIFFIDGQALTPDVFGFYKEGKGYQSSGTTQATDFRPGQWSPHSPRTIKTEINRRGGFGVNGFYLPMNDSSNFGADFHCAPNSIITLKGEDLPQPRNGAPTTTDAYVSELRTDPYAANLVLAVPGISTSTSANLVTNGHFDSNVSNWTATDSTTAWENGQLKITRTAGGGLTANQAFTTETGKRYTISGTINSSTSRGDLRVYNGSGTGGSMIINISGTNGAVTDLTGSFTATSTTSTVVIAIDNNNGVVYVDNVVVKQEDVPRDYSADIKGSGTNKTLTANGNAGVGYEIPGYYGSALSFGGSSHYFDAGSSSDFDFGSGDFTIEYWQNVNGFASTPGLGIWDNVNNQRSWLIYQNSSSYPRFYVSTDGTSSVSINASMAMPTNQWTHFCMERNGSNLVGYVNGVCVGVNTNLGTQSIFTPADPFLIGKWDTSYYIDGEIQDLRVYKGVAKYKGGFDVPKPYTPVGIESWRQVPDTCKNNFATLNPLDAVTDNQSGTDYTQAAHSNGNLTVILSDDFSSARGSIGISAGKYYWEIRIDDNYNAPGMGVVAPGNQLTSYSAGANGASYEPRSDRFRKNGVNFYDGTNNKTDDGLIVGVALDKDAGSISFYADGVLQSNGTMTGLNALSDVHIPECFTYNDGSNVDNTFTWNFGQNPSFSGQVTAGTYTDSNGKGLFKYAPPSGFLALCEDNLPTPAIADPGEHFKTVLWTGVDGTNKIKCGFQPDFVWIKNRDYVNWHSLYDSIRGPYLELVSNDTSGDRDRSSNDGLRSFDSDGFTSGLDDNTGGKPGDSYVAWCWKAGGAAVPNTDGSITSQVSANQDAGFSIVSYTSNGTSGATVGHQLNKTPSFILVKMRSTQAVGSANWAVYHKSLGATKNVWLDAANGENTSSAYWNNTEPTSSVFSLGNDLDTNHTNGYDYIAYCWSEIPGFSKFGTFTGNEDADGPFVYCGFKPALLIVKRTDSTSSWGMYDSSRNSTNPWNKYLVADLPGAEGTATFGDFLSNGFKWRYTGAMNKSGATYIFMAFAESPFQTANAK